MKNFFKTLLAISIFALPALAYTEVTATLTKISDGDTMSFSSNGDEFKCRLYGIDTPEKFKTAKFFKDMQNTGASEKELEFAGQAATNYAKNKLFTGQKYKINVYEKDKYNRNICIVFLQNGDNFNEKIVEDGYAVVYKRGKYTKNKKLRHILNQAQGRAVKAQEGLWRNYKILMERMAEN